MRYKPILTGQHCTTTALTDCQLQIADRSPMLSGIIHCNPYIVIPLNRFILLVLIVLTTGCASTVEPPPPTSVDLPKTRTDPAKSAAVPAPTKPAASSALPPPAVLSEAQTSEFILQILPGNLKDKEGWAEDMQSVFHALHVQPSAENYCAVVAIIEQESSFQADPFVPGLPAIVMREIEQRREKYSIPPTVVSWMLSATSSNGRSYQQRIDTLKTEKELSDLIEEIIAQIPAGKKMFPNTNPIRTGGPMQVSIGFAEAHAKVRHYPYPVHGNLRNEVFSRRGGLYFGTAILLDYPVPYHQLIYRFADYNAGRYSSRNAAFQLALAKISGRKLATDGDLLRYQQGRPAAASSTTQLALSSIGKALQMSDAEINRDLQLEKLSTFSQSHLYQRVFALAGQTAPQPREAIPQINLNSPKFQRKLTTEWFANRVNKRFADCLKRGASSNNKSTKKSKPPTRH